jgi:hypothetical protein
MGGSNSLNRRSFIKLFGAQLAAFTLPSQLFSLSWDLPTLPETHLDDLPLPLQEIMSKIPSAWVDQQGYLRLFEKYTGKLLEVPIFPTEWNKGHSRRWDKLSSKYPWGIVLHWFGDKENYDRTIPGYIRGFDSLREIDGESIRTSAHFVVSDADPELKDVQNGKAVGYIQTQNPAEDGTPYIAAHLQGLDYLGYRQGQQYFVNALNILSRQDPLNRHFLQDLYQGPQIGPNRRTIGIEMSGYHFDNPDHTPNAQQTANVLGLIRALMIRYNIPARNLLGHHEVQIGKPDPGKKYLTLIRYLLGVMALVDADPLFRSLVFESYTDLSQSPLRTTWRYFKFVRDYLVLISMPKHVYEWEAQSKYWQFVERLGGASRALLPADQFFRPLEIETSLRGSIFTDPSSHEGVDLFDQNSKDSAAGLPVRLITQGVCLYVGRSHGEHSGLRAIFRHRQPDGAEILSIYGHLLNSNDLIVGKPYKAGYPLGISDQLSDHYDPFLHFAIGYGATWETALRQNPNIPLNAGYHWVRQHFLDPITYDYQRFQINARPDQRLRIFG